MNVLIAVIIVLFGAHNGLCNGPKKIKYPDFVRDKKFLKEEGEVRKIGMEEDETETGEDYVKKWNEGAEVIYHCEDGLAGISKGGIKEEEFYATCYKLRDGYTDHHGNKESHVLELKCGPYKMDVFYVPSCSKDILESFAASHTSVWNRCWGTLLAFVNEKGDLQLRHYDFEKESGETVKKTEEFTSGKYTFSEFFELGERTDRMHQFNEYFCKDGEDPYKMSEASEEYERKHREW